MATIVEHEFNGAAPSLPSLRKLHREYAQAGYSLIIFRRGEQQSNFELFGDRWHHDGNGLLKAGYKLANELDSRYAEARRAGVTFKL